MIEGISAIALVFAVSGVALNNRRLICCFYLFIVSNILSASIHAYSGLWVMVARDVIFLGLAVEGWWKWRRAK
jgi:nicotinamide riboside transporter PnuC